MITKQLAVFSNRLDKEIVLNHHDIGFLYSLSAVADYRENKTVSSREMALRAAKVLMRRYNENAGIFQAWGDVTDKEQQGRMIIDCNMNLPLLYFASNETGDPMYRKSSRKPREASTKIFDSRRFFNFSYVLYGYPNRKTPFWRDCSRFF